MNEMTNKELVETLSKATSACGDNIALRMLLLIAMERISELAARLGEE